MGTKKSNKNRSNPQQQQQSIELPENIQAEQSEQDETQQIQQTQTNNQNEQQNDQIRKSSQKKIGIGHKSSISIPSDNDPLQHEIDVHGDTLPDSYHPTLHHFQEVQAHHQNQGIKTVEEKGNQKERDSFKPYQRQPTNILKSIHTSQEEQEQREQRQGKSSQKKIAEIPSNNYLRQPKKSINTQILQDREAEWQKIHMKDTQPKRPLPELIKHDKSQIVVEPVRPNVTENLTYTNNLPIVQKLRQQIPQIPEKNPRKTSQSNNSAASQTFTTPIIYRPRRKQSIQTEQNQKSIVTKISTSLIVSIACLGGCVIAEANPKLTVTLTAASLLLSFLAQ